MPSMRLAPAKPAKSRIAAIAILGLLGAACSSAATPTPLPLPAPTSTALPAPRFGVERTGVSDWPTFRLTGAHVGSEGVIDPDVEPELLWSFFTGGVVESSPAVVRGRLFGGTFADGLYALDADSGEPLWRFRVDGLVRASPSVADGLVYFGADDDRFYAIEAATGVERWRF